MDTAFLNAKSSRETLGSLLQLDPAPIDAEAIAANSEKPLPSLPDDSADRNPDPESRPAKDEESTPPRRTSAGPIFFLSRLQRYSSFTLSIFTSIHLANTSLIPLFTRSVPASETYLLQAREVYQTTLSEPLLIGIPVIAHVASGVALRFLRRSHNLRRYTANAASEKCGPITSALRVWPRFSYISASGYVFTALFAAHVAMNRVLPLVVEGDSSNIGLAFVAHGFSRHFALSTVSYVGLLTVGCGHMVWGAAKWLGMVPDTSEWSQRSGTRVPKGRRRTWFGIHATSAAFSLLWAVGGLGVVARGGLTPGWIGTLYDDLYAYAGF
ncbi:hypothetical protein jhhlp_000586 [Lomentospora prolificans]|uniref:Mitochondrial adapter protein MCP1 transmembrane domain-containing protein n=1 Tax=Lomentospora prolificans TaxID=41688 RepID=A0A2N3NJ46_9PEZI|nr:hypothetical protein jhhlp_000586 [Lomentospora prolificans]